MRPLSIWRPFCLEIMLATSRFSDLIYTSGCAHPFGIPGKQPRKGWHSTLVDEVGGGGYPSGYGHELVAGLPSGQGIGSWQACHECKSSTTKDPPCRAAMHVKSVES
ncbi:hypothetical protein TNCV_2020251 [Trichonephila clavipes]|nr:hypothetical protein TNCV_2020251 [Trichonephila clavipes]